MSGKTVRNITVLSVLSFALFFSTSAVLLQPSHEQVPSDVEIILKPSGTGVYYDNWGIYGTASSKSAAVADAGDASGVTRVSNSKFQDFKFNTDAANLIPDGAQITRVVVESQAKLETSSGSTNNLQLVLFSGTTSKGWNLGTGIPVTSTSTVTVAQREFVNNPLTGNAWQKSELVNNAATVSSKTVLFAFGLNQQTQQNSNKILADTFVLKVYIKDTIPPVISGVPANFSVEGNTLNGANGEDTSFVLPTAVDNKDGVVPVTCDKNQAGDFYQYTPVATTVVTCTASDLSGNIATVSFNVTVVDTTPPVFTVDSTMQNWMRSTDVAPNPYDVNDDTRVTALDIVAGDVTSRIVKTTTVDDTVSALYLDANTYNVDDPSGNSAVAETNDVNVVDVLAPATIAADDSATFYVEDYNASTGDIIINTSNSPSTDYTYSLTPIAPGQFEATVEFVFLDEGEELLPGQVPIIGGATVTVSYLDLDPSRVSIVAPIGQAANAFPGVASSATDPFRFVESDVYYIGQFATLLVDDASIPDGTDSVTATVSIDGIPTIVTLTRDPATTTFTAQLNFESVLPENPIGQYIIVPEAGGQITASYGSFAPISATIIPNLVLVPIDPVNFVPDSIRKDVCTSDTDGDKICNDWEDQGANGVGSGLKIPINGGGFYTFTCDAGKTITDVGYELGTRVCPQSNVKDVFVEIDYMANHYPSAIALAQVVSSFKTNGNINLHVILDEQVSEHVDDLYFADPGNVISTKTFVELKQESFGTAGERSICADPNPDPLSSGFACYTQIQNSLAAKRQVVRYAMFAHDQAEFPGSSGYAETPGNDMIISLGSFTGHVGSIPQQSATFMHETGHTLGIKHGGADDVNCKPNYPSVMNYLYQFTDTANVGRPLNYSPVAYTTINENSLGDTLVINHGRGSAAIYQRTLAVGGYSSAGGFDVSGVPLVPYTLSSFVTLASGSLTPYSSAGFGTWNRDGVTNSGIQNVHYFADIPGCEDTATRSLPSRNDWTALNYDMRNSPGWNSGIISITGRDTTTGINDIAELDPTTIAFEVTLADDQMDEGVLYEPVIGINDPHGIEWTITMTYNDVNNPGFTQTTTVNGNGQVSVDALDYTYLDDGTYTVNVDIVNDIGGQGSATATIIVDDKPPTVDSVIGGTVDEGSLFAGTATFTKASVDTVGINVDYDDANPDDVITSASSPVNLSRTYTLAGTKTITVTATDDDISSSSNTGTVLVNNLSATVSIDSITEIRENESISGGGFVDVNSLYDTIVSATVNYGEGAGDELLTLTGNTFALSNNYEQSGTYPVTVTVTDDDGVSYSATSNAVVLVKYDNVINESPVPGSQYESGRNVPVKFTVIEDGQNVANLSPQIYVILANGDRVPTGATYFTAEYVVSSISYHYNLDTSGFPVGNTSIIVKLDDGSEWPVVITVK